MTIQPVTEASLPEAGRIHALSWRESHRSFCGADFVALHTPERQTAYLRPYFERGELYLLTAEKPAGIVSVSGSMIENLYVLPEEQGKGYGTALLQFALTRCAGTPVLWILENNVRARRLYERWGFRDTGRSNRLSESLSEVELSLAGSGLRR
jgi:GNAT superfamily N-acetyltransferase